MPGIKNNVNEIACGDNENLVTNRVHPSCVCHLFFFGRMFEDLEFAIATFVCVEFRFLSVFIEKEHFVDCYKFCLEKSLVIMLGYNWVSQTRRFVELECWIPFSIIRIP